MGATTVLEGQLTKEGTLILGGSIPLPPGPVRVTVEAIADKEDVMAVLERIRQRREARGAQGRTREEIDDEIRTMRDEWDSPERGLKSGFGTAST